MEKIKQGYKQTDIGIIPKDWEVISFGDLVNYTKGYAFKSQDYKKNGVRIIRISDTTAVSIRKDNGVYLDNDCAQNFKNWTLKEDDLVFSTVGSKPPLYESMVGKAIVINKEYEGCLLNQNAVLIRSKQRTKRRQQIIYNHFKTKRYIQFIELIFRGNANQASITLKDLFDFKIPLPKNEKELNCVATALSDTDALIAALDKKIAKKQQIKQGAMQQLLTGKKRLPGFSGEWVEKTYNDIFVRIPTKKYQINSELYLDYGKYKIIDQGKLDFVGYSNDENKLFHCEKEGVIVFGDHTRIVKYSNFDFVVGADGVQLLLCRQEFSTKFVYYLLTIFEIPNTGYNRHFKYLKEILCLVPQSKSEQTAIARLLTDMDHEIAQLEKERDKYKELKAGMMQVLLTGRIRLI